MVNKVNGNNYYTYTRQKSINVSDTGEKFSLDYKQGELQKKANEGKDKDSEEDGVRLELSGSGQAAPKAVRPTVERTSAVKAPAAAKQPTLLDTLQKALSSVFSAIRSFFSTLWNEPATASDAKEADNETIKAEEITALTEALPAEETVQSDNPPATEAISTTEAAETDMFMPEEVMDALMPETTDTELEFEAEDAETAYRMSRERLEEEIRPYLRNKDMAQVISILTDNGNRTVAKNSSLLTYYDKRGRITEPTASDRERILYGDKNTRDL